MKSHSLVRLEIFSRNGTLLSYISANEQTTTSTNATVADCVWFSISYLDTSVRTNPLDDMWFTFAYCVTVPQTFYSNSFLGKSHHVPISSQNLTNRFDRRSQLSHLHIIVWYVYWPRDFFANEYVERSFPRVPEKRISYSYTRSHNAACVAHIRSSPMFVAYAFTCTPCTLLQYWWIIIVC